LTKKSEKLEGMSRMGKLFLRHGAVRRRFGRPQVVSIK